MICEQTNLPRQFFVQMVERRVEIDNYQSGEVNHGSECTGSSKEAKIELFIQTNNHKKIKIDFLHSPT